MSSSYPSGEQFKNYNQTLSLFSDHQHEFLENNTIYETIRSQHGQELRATIHQKRPEDSPQPEPRSTKLAPPQQGSLIDPPSSLNSDHQEEIEEIEEFSVHSNYDHDQLDELASIISGAQVDINQSTRRINRPTNDSASVSGPIDSVNKFVNDSVNDSVNSAVNNSVQDPSTLPTVYPQDTSPSVQSHQEIQGKEKVELLRSLLGIYPHNLKLSLSDQPETLVKESPDFALTSVLGEGGMGTVYEMLQTSLQRSVAVKVAKTTQWNIHQLAQHCHEAQVSGYLSHSHVPPIHLLAHDVDGTPLIIMKKIEGVTWRDLINNPQHDFWDELGIKTEQVDFHLDILESIAQTLAFAHDKGVIHRDLKPANVMVGRYGDVYLLDWGIAIHLETALNEDAETIFKSQRFSNLHQQIVGSPAYMPPEMAMGDFSHQGPMTDVYFLGANLFFLLTRQPVHRGETLEKLLRNILTGHLTPIPDSLTPEMKDLLTSSLRTDPTQRISNAQEFTRLLKVARTAQKSRELEQQGHEALAMLKKLVSHNLLILSEGLKTCVEENLQNYVKMLESYELAHRSFWAAYQVYNGNQQAFAGFTETLTVWLRRFLHLGEVQAAKSIFAGIPNPSPELKAEVDAAWGAYIKALMEPKESEAEVQKMPPPLNIPSSAVIKTTELTTQDSSEPRRTSGIMIGVIVLMITLIGFWLSRDEDPSISSEIPHQQVVFDYEQVDIVDPQETAQDLRATPADLSKRSSRVDDKAQDRAESKRVVVTSHSQVIPTPNQTAAREPIPQEIEIASQEIKTQRADAPKVLKDVYSFQIAATRNKKSALNHIDHLRETVDLGRSDSMRVFWLKSVEVKPGKTVHRIMLGQFKTRAQAKSLTKIVRTLMKKPMIKRVKL
jgi:serine/threonine protein kinase